jgi:hypothetical protein
MTAVSIHLGRGAAASLGDLRAALESPCPRQRTADDDPGERRRIDDVMKLRSYIVSSC